ncbi:MAG: ABC transporter ATP-binding protein, partial [Acidimicrobiaceae bacterium]|nr:ABC transporter ATP-binding protein [Acidimicrobiaceae bacterium]
ARGRIVADGTAGEVKSLASGRTVRATINGADEQVLGRVHGADSVEVRGDTVWIHSGDSDAVLRYLLDHTDAHDIEVTARGLEDAFIALTGEAHGIGAKEGDQ